MYADDTPINFNLKNFNPDCVEAEITNELERVNTWLKLNKLCLNTHKTKLMVRHRKQKKVREFILCMDHNQIKQVPVFNFLDFMLDENLSWKNHTKMVKNKTSRVILIGTVYRLKCVFPKEVLITLYKPLIASYIHYEILVWSMDCNKIEGMQKNEIVVTLLIQLRYLKKKDYLKYRIYFD